MTENNGNEKKDQFIIVLARISSVMTGLCLAILVFSMTNTTYNSNYWSVIRLFIWLAVILFAITTFRCVDKYLDKIYEKEVEVGNVLYPKKERVEVLKEEMEKVGKKWYEKKGLTIIDNRLKEYRGLPFFFIGWCFFIITLLFIGLQISSGFPQWWDVVAVAVVVVSVLIAFSYAVLFLTYQFRGIQ
ncbi:MAG: hypothetical protein LWW95_10880 [Candidatus Desulfofervidus auxilii]|nr:hypothetical protein [Candidatus Desulfofervidus auxilii]